MKTISVVLPCLNEAQNLPLLIPQIIKSIPKKYNYEIILVNDGSSDNTTTMIELLARKNKNIKGIIFYKRFGHQPALKAGIENKNLRNSLKNIDKICKDFDFDPLRIFVIKLFVSYTISIKVFKEIVFQ